MKMTLHQLCHESVISLLYLCILHVWKFFDGQIYFRNSLNIFFWNCCSPGHLPPANANKWCQNAPWHLPMTPNTGRPLPTPTNPFRILPTPPTPMNPWTLLTPPESFQPLPMPFYNCRPLLTSSIPSRCLPNQVTILDTCQLLLIPLSKPYKFLPIAAYAIWPLMTSVFSSQCTSSTMNHFRCLPNSGDPDWPLPLMSLPPSPGILSIKFLFCDCLIQKPTLDKWVIYHSINGKQSHRFGLLLEPIKAVSGVMYVCGL